MAPAIRSVTNIRRATSSDAGPLARAAAVAFSDAFAADNDPGDMAAYLASAFGHAIQSVELADTRNVVLIAERDGEHAGYAMLRAMGNPSCITDSNAVEIARLYAAPSSIRTGVGSALMSRCVDEARSRRFTTMWLGVWEHNARAIAFYGRWGFDVVGRQSFLLGTDRQSDLVMARQVDQADP